MSLMKYMYSLEYIKAMSVIKDTHPSEPSSRRELKALLQDAGTRQKHQDLIVGHPRGLVHAGESVEQPNDLPLVEERNRGERSSTEPIRRKAIAES
jgi:hypothetical protein